MSDFLKFNLLGAFSVAVLVSIYAVENIYYEIFMVSALIIGMIVSLIRSQKSVEMLDSQKRLYWFIIIPVISLIAYLFSEIGEIV